MTAMILTVGELIEALREEDPTAPVFTSAPADPWPVLHRDIERFRVALRPGAGRFSEQEGGAPAVCI